MHIESAARRRRLISLTPLIDVVFILLIFFMLATSFLEWRSFSLGIPGDSQITDLESEVVMVRLLADGGLEVDGEPMTDTAALVVRFREIFADDPDQLVIVRPDGEVALQRVVTVVERLNAAGGNRITLNRERR